MTSVVTHRETNTGLQVGRRERARGRDPVQPEKNKSSITLGNHGERRFPAPAEMVRVVPRDPEESRETRSPRLDLDLDQDMDLDLS